MSIRLNVSIPNVKHSIPGSNAGFSLRDYVSLGIQDYWKWRNFNDYWFGENNDGGLVSCYDIKEFYDQYMEMLKTPGEDQMTREDYLKRLVDYAIENELDVYFASF